MDEDNREQNSEEVSKKRTRGPTLCKKLKKRIVNQNLECSISFNEYGDPIGDMLKDFRTYVGSVVRFQVDINIESWESVNQGLKDAIWDDIKNRWKLDDSRKKNVLERAGKQWRDFKGKLTKNFLRKGKDPCEQYNFITEDQWEIFKKRRETEEFKEISEKAKESQKHNEHVHYLGPSKYVAKRTKWCVDDPITSLNDSESVNPSYFSSERTGRSYDWVRARTKPREGGGYYFPNEKTKEVFEKMEELQRQVSDGSWTPQGHDDILSRALGRKEHGGRVRGVGGGAKIKDVFGSGKSKYSGVISVDELATITQEITKKVQKECEERMNEMMNLKLEGFFNQLKQMGVSLPDDIGTPKNENVQSSCQSVDQEDDFSNLKDSVSEMTPKSIVQISKEVESKGSVTLMKKTHALLGDDLNSSEHCRSLRFLLNKRFASKEGDVFKFEENGENPIYITNEDVDQFLKMSWLNIPILEIFLKYVSTLCNQLKDNTFAFMLPSRLAITHSRHYQRQQEAAQYMADFLIANKKKRFILAPYIQDDHWMLLLFCLYESAIYVFDPLKQDERKIRLMTPVQTAFKLYVREGGLKNNRKEFLWHHTEVQCPQQGGGTECGFFVMRYMHDIVMLSQQNPDMNWKVSLGSRSYTKKEINEIRELWANFFTLECL